ncbi:MAG: SCO family protein [Pirellulales bacterium]|nr:SCO family protein [Pirellulales bacterium]
MPTHAKTALLPWLLSLVFGLVMVFSATAVSAQDQMVPAEIGGRFMLEDHNGQIVTDQHYRGQFLLITFGYTYCPDICPTNLVNMSDALAHLGEKAAQVAPVFVTIDPKRDTAERLRDYVDHFDQRIVGLTGPQPMIDSISKRYKIVTDVHRPEGWDQEDYIVDHTASIFLMSPEGGFLVKFAHGMDPKAMAKRITEFM